MSISVLDMEQHNGDENENKITFPFKTSQFNPQNHKYKGESTEIASEAEAGKTFFHEQNLAMRHRTMVNSDYNGLIGKNSITLSSWSALRKNMNHRGFGKAVFFMYKNLHNILKPSSIAASDLSKGTRQLSTSGFLISNVISASLGRGHNVELSNPVTIKFEHLDS